MNTILLVFTLRAIKQHQESKRLGSRGRQVGLYTSDRAFVRHFIRLGFSQNIPHFTAHLQGCRCICNYAVNRAGHSESPFDPRESIVKVERVANVAKVKMGQSGAARMRNTLLATALSWLPFTLPALVHSGCEGLLGYFGALRRV